MAAINFNNAFEVLQLTPGVSYTEIKQRYETLVSPTLSAESAALKKIAAAYNDLQLLSRPYELLTLSEQTALLNAFDEMSDVELDFWFTLYPHSSRQFYWDSKNYPQIATYLTKSVYKTALSTVGTFLGSFTSCYGSNFGKEEEHENAVELPLWPKKNQ
ncbi:hypothetical protein A8135_10105 [Legionella jamestowniensis]|uniref:J domain-containing protein n=1 Tax=Legionella jamestowniensis TaxID=455 RepID=A0ABX2XWT6_9GAMM|nr:hypothetical protein [Legionella jamestowniensis]OCH99084.1 hypothetical protein A8135_10105 [Legionella jamestowniensis]